jgi:quinol monooxygenase YgiN
MKTKADLIIIATAKAKPGKEAALAAALSDVAGPTRAQPGAVSWALYRAGATLVAVERWSSRDLHDRHLQGPHVQALMGRMADLLAEPPSIVEHEIVVDDV